MEDLKQESIRRMKILKLDEKIINDFIKEDILYVSKIQGEIEVANQNQINLVKEFEKEHKVKIYHIIQLVSKNKSILYFLYVNQKRKYWVQDRKDISLGYIETITVKNLRELRVIGAKIINGKVSVVKE